MAKSVHQLQSRMTASMLRDASLAAVEPHRWRHHEPMRSVGRSVVPMCYQMGCAFATRSWPAQLASIASPCPAPEPADRDTQMHWMPHHAVG
eukprot:6776167-Alexandrium_andersonii.AAC.1